MFKLDLFLIFSNLKSYENSEGKFYHFSMILIRISTEVRGEDVQTIRFGGRENLKSLYKLFYWILFVKHALVVNKNVYYNQTETLRIVFIKIKANGSKFITRWFISRDKMAWAIACVSGRKKGLWNFQAKIDLNPVTSM